MAFDLSTASNVLKVNYLPTMQKLLNNATILWSRLDKDSSTQDVQGKSFTIALQKGRNLASGLGVAELSTLPVGESQVYTTAVVPNKYLYSNIRVSGPVIRATRSNAGAFVRAVESEMKGVMVDMKRAMNRQIHGNGTDALAYWTSADDTSPEEMDDGTGYAFTHLPVGQTIDCSAVDASDHTTLLNTGRLVVTLGAEAATNFSVAWATGTVSGTAAGDYLVANLPGTTTSTLGRQMMGIYGIISDQDPPNAAGGLASGLHGLAVASNAQWRAQMLGSWTTKRDLAFSDMQKVISKIATNSAYSEKDIKFILCNYPIRDKYVELCTNERFHYNTMTLDGGFRAVTFNELPIVADNQAKRGAMFFVVPDTLTIFRSSDFDWMDKDGAVLSRIANQDGYEATLFHYGDLGCKARNGNGALIGLNE